METHTDLQLHPSDASSLPSSSGVQAVKIQLISNNIGYGPPPNCDDEVEQRLTLTANGRVWVSSYSYGSGDGHYKLNYIKRYKIDTAKARSILSAFSHYFYQQFTPYFATDIGYWKLRITVADGTVSRFTGSLCTDGASLSDLLRKSLCAKSLWCFKEV